MVSESARGESASAWGEASRRSARGLRHRAAALAVSVWAWAGMLGAPKTSLAAPRAAPIAAAAPGGKGHAGAARGRSVDPPAGAAAERDDGFRAFQLRFVAAVLANRVDEVVAMTTFPLHSYEMAGAVAKAVRRKGPLDPSIDEATMRKHFKRIFDAKVRKHLATFAPVYTSGDDDPAMNRYAIGHSSGKSWSAWFVFTRAGADGSGDWKLVATDNVSQ